MLRIRREKYTDKGVFGRLYIDEAFVCFTLENDETLIPCGAYEIQNSISPKFKRELPLIYSEDCPASKGIRIHRGNYKKDSRGCVLVGMGRKDNMIVESTPAETMVTMICRNQKKLFVE